MDNDNNIGPEMVPPGDAETPPPMDSVEELRAEMGRLLEANSKLQAINNRLHSEQITGDDHRLTEFWAEAARLATEAGHCDIYDNMVEALGGPRRTCRYVVTLALVGSVDIEVEAEDIDDAWVFAREEFENGDYDVSDCIRVGRFSDASIKLA